MASSDNMTSLETWAFRPAFENSWISDSFARDTEALTKALQKSISGGRTSSSLDVSPAASQSVSPFSDLYNIVNNPDTPSSNHQGCQSFTSSGGGSEPETASKRVFTRSAAAAPRPTGKITKRKSRASKRSLTTFITADPANFRQMVQQVTGARFTSGSNPAGSVLKPEPQRPVGVVNRLQAGCLLPTLDTSAFLLDHHQQQQQVVGPVGAAVAPQVSLGFGPTAVAAENGGAGFDFDGFCTFPTLESWKVM